MQTIPVNFICENYEIELTGLDGLHRSRPHLVLASVPGEPDTVARDTFIISQRLHHPPEVVPTTLFLRPRDQLTPIVVMEQPFRSVDRSHVGVMPLSVRAEAASPCIVKFDAQCFE